MAVTDFLAALGDIGTLVAILWLIIIHRKIVVLITRNGGTMATPESEQIDWIRRQGRFHQADDDTPDRIQIMPGPLIPRTAQTHTRTAGGEFHDGPYTRVDT